MGIIISHYKDPYWTSRIQWESPKLKDHQKNKGIPIFNKPSKTYDPFSKKIYTKKISPENSPFFFVFPQVGSFWVCHGLTSPLLSSDPSDRGQRVCTTQTSRHGRSRNRRNATTAMATSAAWQEKTVSCVGWNGAALLRLGFGMVWGEGGYFGSCICS